MGEPIHIRSQAPNIWQEFTFKKYWITNEWNFFMAIEHEPKDKTNVTIISQMRHTILQQLMVLINHTMSYIVSLWHLHTGQCKRTGGCYNELVVAFYSTGGGVKGKKIYTCWLYYLFINLQLFYLWWHLSHRPPVTLQIMALPSNWWFNSWFGLQIQHSSGVLSWQAFFSSVTA